MKPLNFFWILLLSALMAAYSAFVQGTRNKPIGGAAHPTLVRVAEAAELWRDRGTIFLDVRTDGDFAAGHIPGAIHFPDGDDLDMRLAALHPRLDRAATIVVYCKSVDCGKSLWIAIRLHQAGLTQTKIFPGGWNDWFNNGQPRSEAVP